MCIARFVFQYHLTENNKNKNKNKEKKKLRIDFDISKKPCWDGVILRGRFPVNCE